MDFEVTFLDIGHGDCTVITFTEPDECAPGGERTRCIVVDAGEEGSRGVSNLQDDAPSSAWRLAAYLKARKIRTIDLLIATHIDSDHIGGLLTFLKEYTAKSDGQGDRFWNDRTICIGQYWGPLRDVYWGRIDEEEGSETRKRYHRMMQLLIKLKVKKKLTSQDREEIERLEREITRLRESIDDIVAVHSTRDVLVQSVRQNYELGELVRPHVADLDRDVLAPDVHHLPSNPFRSVQIDLLWPDLQIPDSMIRAALLRPVNVHARTVKFWNVTKPAAQPRRPMSLPDLLERIMDNQEQVARSEDRKANNRSIVVSVRPTEWNGPDETYPVVLLTGDAESESWQRMIPRYQDEQLAAYILKVPHHGSAQNGITLEALQAIHPRFAIVSVGQIHHLPEARTLNLLRRGTEGPLDIFCTERNHNPARHGACLHLLEGCVRRTIDDYRGVVFNFDTARGDLSVVELRFVKEEGGYDLEAHWIRDHETDPDHILWCRQEAW